MTKQRRTPNAAFMKPYKPDAVLAELVGSDSLPRTEIVKKVWEYIKKNGLQDKKEKRNINADEKLKPLFDGKEQISMFEMTRHINNHIS